MKKNRAFLKWAGGKYPLLDEIKKHLPEGDCLIEPFAGAGSVFLNTHYQHYLLADINSDLIDLYRIVQSSANKFVHETRLMFCQQNNDEQAYYAFRAEFNQCTDKFRRAALFLYLNRHCYNGLCRYNLRGEFNVPFGRYKKPYFPEEEIYAFAEQAQKARFVCQSYDVSMVNVAAGSVVYCDPPYAPLSTTANFTAYHTASFNALQQQHLARLAESLHQQQIPVLISNHDTVLTRQWYQNATEFHQLQVRRNISRNGSARNKVDELLALYHAKDA